MAAVLYYNGKIYTMKDETPETVEAVLSADGRILAAGTMDEVRRTAGFDEGAVLKRDLKGAAMMPAFLDPHSHITAVMQIFGYESLTDVTSFDELLERLLAFKERTKLEPGKWLIGIGYDHNFLKEQKHPDKTLLDRVFKENPVMLSHSSGHMGVVSSLALQLMNITAETENPKGGVIGRVEGTKEPNGYLEETAFTGAGSIVPKPDMVQLSKQFSMAERLYLQNGITTIQDGFTGAGEWSMLKYMADKGMIQADVVAYADMKSAKDLLEKYKEYEGQYLNHLRIGGYKIFLDGSPQGRTAWITEPYEEAEDGYCGYPIYKDEEVQQFFEAALKEKRQLLVHCNGDAAADQMITACERARDATGCAPSLIRPVMIHAQLVREDELKRMAALSMTASIFVAHTYYWGDIHMKNLGCDRAMRISPARTAVREHVNVTLHQDSPVIEPNMIETVWCAVNRTSKNGVVMGASEMLTPYEALRAITINTAYQYGEEAIKGSIEAGKNADFVILSDNPMEVPPMLIKNISVLETIKDGKTLYKAAGAADEGID